MKYSILSSFFLTFVFLSLPTAQAAVCTQAIQPAVSPDGVCQTFRNSCAVPEDWRAVASCSMNAQSQETNTLQARLLMRLNQRDATLIKKAAKNEQEEGDTNSPDSMRIGSGNLTRTYERKRRLPTAESATTRNRHFASRGVNAAQINSQYEDDKNTSPKSYFTARSQSFRQRNDIQRSGALTENQTWQSKTKQHMTHRKYGRNPYRLGARYQDEQKINRAAMKSVQSAEERRFTQSRRYRGARKVGNLHQDTEFLKTEAEKLDAVREALYETRTNQ